MLFSHLHNHTQYSLLDGASNIDKLFKKAQADGQPAMAITDHGNMFGAFEFVAKAKKYGIKPIVGCEFYVVEDHHIKQFSKEKKDKRYHQLLLAKDEAGYKNLAKLCSIGYIEGMYSKYPRITKELIVKYHEGLIATTCCLGALVPQTILKQGEEAGYKEFKWWLDLFGDDYYVEFQRHGIPDQEKVNKVLVKFAVENNVRIIASNDSHYVDVDDYTAHDILLCVNTNEKMSTPKMRDYDDEEGGGKVGRFAFANDQFYLKNTSEMIELFKDLPEAIDNTNHIVDKIAHYSLEKEINLPNFIVPQEFKIHEDDVMNQWEFLKHITFEGAKTRYVEITPEIQERIDFELFTIKSMGFAGYFLIVSDFIDAARKMKVMVGPGRGSAAGSVVAYCVGITNIDPIKYGLLFERFLNPDRKSMPDIDTDFDDEGRGKVIDYVVEKYGRTQVAQIVTYGTMAAKSSIKDVARVMDLPLSESNALVKLIPDKPTYGMNLTKVFEQELDGEKGLKNLIQPEEVENVLKMRELIKGNDLTGEVLRNARRLEGTVRNVGIHAAGIIIAPRDLTDILPVCISKESPLLVTQFEGTIIENAGVIKMDFLGLKNLTIIRNCLKMIDENHGIKIDIDNIPLDDPKTYEIFQRGETNSIFQFESDGMKKHMKDLKPDQFGDLIAMNALYRPGPIAYIPNYIRRKHGQEEVVYDLIEMEEYLADTYGITVYQEQVMLLSQKLAGFTKGQADTLRKAMGKKDRYTLDKLKDSFINGGVERNLNAEKLEKVWKDWEAFASYAFNKSHSTCYAFVAYQTAYLKANYTPEYMAAVLTNSLGAIEKITFTMEECKNLGTKVLGPDINESDEEFAVNKKGEIRFGLGGIKGTGTAAVASIISERKLNGPFANIYNFIQRVNLRTVNKKCLESLIHAGALDLFEEIERYEYFAEGDNGNLIERLIKYASKFHEEKNSSQNSLFGSLANSGSFEMPKPRPHIGEKWGDIEKLRYEKEVVGFYISGHPLDDFAIEMSRCTPLDVVFNEEYRNREIAIGGVISAVQLRQSKNGNPWALMKIEDYSTSIELSLFGKDYVNFANFLTSGLFIFMRAKVQSRWNSTTDFELKPLHIELLTEIRSKMVSSIKIQLNINTLTTKFIDILDEKMSLEQGNCGVQFAVFDPNEGVELNFISRKSKIKLTNDLYKFLNSSEEIHKVSLG
jgi:DNA polymerase III subunit alpha